MGAAVDRPATAAAAAVGGGGGGASDHRNGTAFAWLDERRETGGGGWVLLPWSTLLPVGRRHPRNAARIRGSAVLTFAFSCFLLGYHTQAVSISEPVVVVVARRPPSVERARDQATRQWRRIVVAQGQSAARQGIAEVKEAEQEGQGHVWAEEYQGVQDVEAKEEEEEETKGEEPRQWK